MNSAAGTGGRALLAAGTKTYHYGDLADLDGVPGALRCVVETLTSLGYRPATPSGADVPSYLLDPGLQELKDAVREAAASAPVVVVYYTGHGMKPQRDPYLLVTAQATSGQLEDNALEARQFVRLVLRRDANDQELPPDEQPQVLVILDCCFSGVGGAEALKESLQDIGSPKVWVLASASLVEYAEQGRFAEALQQVLHDPEAGSLEPLLDLNWVAEKINKVLRQAGQGAGWFPPGGRSTGFTPFFPNPDYVPGGVAGLTVAEQQYWVSRLRGAPAESAAAGFYITGRTGRRRVVEDLAAWMRDPGRVGLAVVTGGPGCGKSAMLALPVLLTDRERRDALIAEADHDSLAAQAADLFDGLPVFGIHAGGLNLYEVVKAIAKHFGRSADSPEDLLADLEDRPEASPLILVIDGVDEAREPPKLLTELLQPLARRAAVRIVIGARRHVLAGVADAGLTIDLDTEEYRDPQALADYAYQLLIAAREPDVATPYRGRHDDTAVTVAAGIAEKATKPTTTAGQAEGQEESFLLAQLLARAVRGRPQVLDITNDDWAKQLPAGIGAAFDEDLRYLLDKWEPNATVEPIAKALLTALAWAKGPGLPRRWIWGPVAQALAARTGTGTLDLDRYGVRWLLDNAGAYIIEDLGPGQQSVFRPFHDLIAANLRGQPSDEQAAADPTAAEAWEQRRQQTEKDVTRALLGTIPTASGGNPDWEQAHPYLRTYLAQHAAAGGPETLSALVHDADFLAAADPVTLSPLLSFTVPELRDIARIYRRALPQLGTDPQANAAYLQEAARALAGTAAERTGVRHLARPESAPARQDADQQHWLPRARGDPQANAAYLQDATRALAATAAERTGVHHLARPESAPARQDADQQHWLPRARGGPQESTAGFYITGKTGRLRAAMDLAAWMRDSDDGGLAVVTGSPGCGKSALLALPVLLTNRERRETLLAAADQDSLIARAADLFGGLPVIGVHARGMNPSQLAGAIASYLGRSADSPGDLLEDLDEHPESSAPIVVINAVDEARDPRSLLTGLLLPLARRPGLRVVVGARRHVLSGIGYADLIIDLDSDAYQDPEALTEYVHNLLIASGEPGVTTPYQSDHAAAAVAVTIAQRARGSFLVGRLLALAARGGAEPADITRDDLPTSVAEAFDNDLARLGSKEPIARALLAALAWARGPGLPWEDIWVRVAQALVRLDFGDEQPSITGDDVRWLLDTARSYVVEEVGKGQRSVFRLFHDLLAAHLRGDPIIERGYGPAAIEAWSQRCARTERAVTDALLSSVPATSDGKADWELAHPYLRTYLAEHAAAAGPKALSDLVHDADFLAAADPVTLNPLLSFTVPELSDIARTYWRARPQLGTDLRANAAYLQEAAHALVGTAGEQTNIRPLYRTQLASVRQDNSVLTFTGRAGAVFSVALGASPDGRLLLVSGCEDGTVRLWDPAIGAAAGAPLTGHEGWVFSVAFGASPDSQALLASGGEDGTVRLWDPTTGAAMGAPLTGHTGPVQAVALGASPDGRALLASGGEDGTVRLWDPTTGAAMGAPLTGHTGPVQAVALGASPDGRALLASGGWDGTVRLWDPTTGAAMGAPLTGHTGPVQAVALGASPDGRALLASGGWDGTVRLWDPTTGAAMGAPLTGHAGWVFSVAFGASPDGRALLASGGGDGTVRLWDPTTGAAMGAPLTGHTGPVEAVAFGASPDGRLLLASGGGDNTVRLWDLATGAAVGAPLTGHTGPVQTVAFGASPDGRLLLASGSWDNTVRLWDLATGAAVGAPLTGHTGPVQTVAFGASPDGRLLLASGSWDNTVRLWDLATGAAVGALLTGHTGSVQAVGFGASSGGRVLLASGGGDGTVRLWDLATSHPAGAPPLTGHAGQVFSVAFGASPDGRLLLASGGEDGTVRLWDPATGAAMGAPLTGHTGPVQAVAFGASPDGRVLLASGSWDNTVRLWDPATGAAMGAPLTGHTGPVQAVAFGASPDGRVLLASGSWDNTVRLWDLAAAACIATFRRRCSVNSIAAVGLMLAIGDDEGICVIELEG